MTDFGTRKNGARAVLALMLVALAAGAAFARGGGGCLEEGTPVLTPSGPAAVQCLAVGDQVLSVCGDRLIRATVAARKQVQPGEYIVLRVAGRVLRVTAEHPMAVAPGTFREASYLRAGHALLLRDGDSIRPTQIESVARIKAERPACNLLVSPGGTYFADGLLVHNKGCFLPDTPILRADGRETAIADVRPGEKLLAFTPEGEIVSAEVLAVLARDVEEYAVVTTDRITLRVTLEHPFYVGDGTFKTLEALKIGDSIFAWDGRGLAPQPIRGIERIQARVRVYNLQTDAPHTYFASGIAVHNKGGGGGCFPAGTQISTPRGSTAIEALRPGDIVLSVGTDQQAVDSAVEAVHLAYAPVTVVRTTAGELKTTAEHPLMTADGAFRPAGELMPGDQLCIFRAGSIAFASVIECRSTGEACPVFNLRVGDPHTFIADGFVVHNKGGGFSGGFHSSGSFHGGGVRGNTDFNKEFGPTWGPILEFIWQYLFIIIVGGLIIFRIATSLRQNREENLDFSYSGSAIENKAAKTRKLLEFVAKSDPKFAPDLLAGTTRSTFVLLQKCWQSRDYTLMKPLLMPDLYEEHLAQIQGMVHNHEINCIESLSVTKVDLVNVRYPNAENAREFTALISASARDYYIDDRTRDFVRGDDAPAAFQEFWTFHLVDGKWLLREIEQTKESDALKTDNFFEPFTDHGVKVVYAEDADREGPVGPSVAAGTEWKLTRVERLLNYLVQSDKLWDKQAMSQQARKVFLEVCLAREGGDPERVPATDLFPEIAAHLKDEISRRKAEGASVEFRNLCVRNVELVLVRNYSDNTQDEFTARITAHAQQIVRRNDQVASEQPYVTPFEQYWTFGRLDNQWKLKEVEPPAKGRELVGQENVDEGVAAAQLEWYYQHPRAT